MILNKANMSFQLSIFALLTSVLKALHALNIFAVVPLFLLSLLVSDLFLLLLYMRKKREDRCITVLHKFERVFFPNNSP